MEDECGFDQTCLNTKGSYVCVPTSCPEFYTRDEKSGQCIQMCDLMPNKTCSDKAIIAQTISYTVLSLPKISSDIPLLKLVTYDIKNQLLEKTFYSFIENSHHNLFELKSDYLKKGIFYIYLKKLNEFKREKIYKLKILANSYDEMSLTYITNFIVYVYVL